MLIGTQTVSGMSAAVCGCTGRAILRSCEGSVKPHTGLHGTFPAKQLAAGISLHIYTYKPVSLDWTMHAGAANDRHVQDFVAACLLAARQHHRMSPLLQESVKQSPRAKSQG